MSKKLFQFVTAIIGGVQTVAIGSVTYFVEDKTMAMEINGAIAVLGTAIETICAKFVKEEEK